MPQDPKQIDPIGRLPGDTDHPNAVGHLPGDVNAEPIEGSSGRLQPYSYEDYHFQPKLGQNNNLLRAQHQTGWQQAGRFLGNLVPNIAGSLIENVGYLGALGSEWGDDRDYSNTLTKLGQDMHNSWFGDIYREHPNQVWDPMDPAWWYNSTESLVESATAFAGEGALIGKMFEGLGKVTQLARLSRTGANLFAHVGTAATLAYTEAAQFGGTTYDTVYKEQYQKLKDQGMSSGQADDQARHLASQGAAAAVQLNTIFATGLNMLELAPFFHEDGDILDWFKSKGRRAPGESMPEYQARLQATGAGDSDVSKMINLRNKAIYSYLGTAATEGTEEVVNQWAEQRGLARGKEGRELKGLSDLLGDIDHFFSDTMNQSGALSFVLGAVGGVAQNVLLEHIPINQVYVKPDGSYSLHKFDAEVTPDGQYKTKLVTSKYKEETGNRHYFENIKDAVVNDVKRVNEISSKLVQAIEKGDNVEAEKLRFQMFDTSALHSIQLGMGENFAGQYEDIRNLDNTKSLHEQLIPALDQLNQQLQEATDPAEKQQLLQQRNQLQTQIDSLTGVTEAMKRGFAKSPNDNAYKAKATDAITDIKEYQKLWDDIQKKHSSGEEFDSRYADYLFGKEIDIKRKDKILKNFAELIRQSEVQRDTSLPVDQDSIALKTVSDIVTDNTVRDNLNKDVADINKAKNLLLDPKTEVEGHALLSDVVGRYLPNIDSVQDLPAAMPKVLGAINDSIKALDKKLANNIEATTQTTQYAAWKEKNPGKNVLDYIKLQAKRNAVDEDINADKAELKHWQEELAINQQFLGELRTHKGKQDFIKQAKATINTITKGMNERINKDNKAFIDNLFDQKSVDELTTVQKDQYAKQLQSQITDLKSELDKLQDEYHQAATDRKAVLEGGLINRLKSARTLIKNKALLTSLDSQIKALQSRIDNLQNQLDSLGGATSVSDVVKPVNPVTATPVVPIVPLSPVVSANPIVQAVQDATKVQKRQAAILAFLDDYEEELAGGKLFSLNALADAGFVGKGKLSQAKAAAIMQVFANEHADLLKEKESLAGINQVSSAVTTLVKVEEATPGEPPITPNDIPEEDPSDSTIGQPSDADIKEFTSLILDVVSHEGAKVSDAAIKINALTHDYEQDILRDENGTYYINRNTYQLNDAVNPLYLQPGYLKAGDEVRLVIDTDWAGTVNDTRNFTYGMPLQKSDKFNDYVDPNTNGIIMNSDKYGNMPVKIVDVRSGTTLGYLPRMDWITAKYPNGSDDYRNVVDIKYDREGNVVFEDNVAKQAEANRLLREKLATAYNMGKKEGLSSKVTSRDSGTLLRTTPGKVSDLIPDESVELALLGTTEARTGAQTPATNTDTPEFITRKKMRNVPGVLLMAPNGRKVFEPIWADRVSKADIDTVIRAIEIYLSVDGDTELPEDVVNRARNHAEQIQTVTGFNVTTSNGLKSFVNQYYTYTQGFNDAQVAANQDIAPGTKRTPTFMLAIADTSGAGYKKSIVKAGVSFLNRLSKAGVNSQGRINSDFRALLEDKGIGLASRFRNVVFSRGDVRGINSPGAISTVTFQPVSNTFEVNDFKSYNHFIKSNAQTTAYGKLKMNEKIPGNPKDTYVYFANPVTNLDYEGTISQDIRVTRKPKKAPTDIETPIQNTEVKKSEITEAEKEYLKNLPDPLGDPLFKVNVVYESAGSTSGLSVNLENLQHLLNFTPVENQNGKVPSEVLEELTKLGLTTLPEGFNPFYTC